MRLFIETNLDKKTKKSILSFIKTLKTFNLGRVEWQESSQLHLTLKFLGEVEAGNINKKKDEEEKEGKKKQGELEKIKKILKETAEKTKPFKLAFNRLGKFPKKGRTKIIWLGAADKKKERRLKKINETLEDSLFPLGFKKEKREFIPHITLGRVKKGNEEKIHKVIESFNGKKKMDKELKRESVKFRIDSLKLTRSRLFPDGAKYDTIKKVAL